MVSERAGIPVALAIPAASTHESTVVDELLGKVRIPRPGRGRPRSRIRELALDKAFDGGELRRRLRRRGIRASIPERKPQTVRQTSSEGAQAKAVPSQPAALSSRVGACLDGSLSWLSGALRAQVGALSSLRYLRWHHDLPTSIAGVVSYAECGSSWTGSSTTKCFGLFAHWGVALVAWH